MTWFNIQTILHNNRVSRAWTVPLIPAILCVWTSFAPSNKRHVTHYSEYKDVTHYTMLYVRQYMTWTGFGNRPLVLMFRPVFYLSLPGNRGSFRGICTQCYFQHFTLSEKWKGSGTVFFPLINHGISLPPKTPLTKPQYYMYYTYTQYSTIWQLNK